MIKTITWIMVWLIYFNVALAQYPVIITDQHTNHTQAKELVYSIPEHYYKHVDVIEFVQDGSVWCQIDEYHPNHNCSGMAITHWWWWDWSAWLHPEWEHGSCFDVTILTTVSFDVLQHELGHVHEQCELRRNVNNESELYARAFKVVR